MGRLEAVQAAVNAAEAQIALAESLATGLGENVGELVEKISNLS